MKKEKNLPQGKRKEDKIWSAVVFSSIGVFILLRFFVDGLSYPSFNFYWNLYFFALFIFQFFRDRLRTCFLKEETVFFLFFLVSVISAGMSSVQGSAVVNNSQTLAYMCIMVLISRNIGQNRARILYAMLAFAALSIALYGLYQYFWGLEHTRQMIEASPEMLGALPPTFVSRLMSDRIFATFVYPNIYAGFLIFVLPLAFFMWLYDRRTKALQVLSGSVFAVAFINLLLTDSLGGMLVFILVSFLMLLFIVLKDRRKFWAAISLVVFISSAAAYAGYATDRLPKTESLVDRARYWQAAAEVFRENPVLGAGPGNYRYFYTRFKHPESMEARHAHSVFFETLAETGLAGTLFLMAFFIMCLAALFKNCREKPPMAAGLGFAFLAFTLHNMIDFHFINPSAAVLFFIAAGVGFGMKEKKPVCPAFRLTKWLNCLIIITVILMASNYTRYVFAERNLAQARRERNLSTRLFYVGRARVLFPNNFQVYEVEGDAYLNSAMLHAKETDYLSALAAYRRAVSLNLYLPRVYRKKAFAYEALGDMDNAERMYLMAVKSYPVKKQYNLEMAIFYKRQGREREFKYFYEKSAGLASATVEEAHINRGYIQWIESQK